MDDRYKRLNSATGDPFQAGYQDETGRIFLRYLEELLDTVSILELYVI